MLGAAVIEDGAGNRKLSKIKEESRTDAMVDLTMAMGYAAAVPVEDESPLARYYAAGGKVEIVGV